MDLRLLDGLSTVVVLVVRVMLDELGVYADGVSSVELVVSCHLVVMVMLSCGTAFCPTHHEVIRLHVVVNQMVVWMAHHVERMLEPSEEVIVVIDVRGRLRELHGHVCRVLLLLMVMMLLLLLLLLMLLCDIVAQWAQLLSLTTILL